MSSPRSEILRRWVLPAAGLAVAPKCGLCLAAYAGFGALLELGGPEVCGGVEPLILPPALFGAMAAAGFLLHRFAHRPAPGQPAIAAPRGERW